MAKTPPLPDALEAAPATVNSAAPAPAINATPRSAQDAPPGAGGSYLRDPLTGALTLVTPSTVQE